MENLNYLRVILDNTAKWKSHVENVKTLRWKACGRRLFKRNIAQRIAYWKLPI